MIVEIGQFLLCSSHMNTRNTSAALFQGTPSVLGLFRALWRVIAAWLAARRYRKLDFRQATGNEVTPEMQQRIDAVRSAPDEDFVNV